MVRKNIFLLLLAAFTLYSAAPTYTAEPAPLKTIDNVIKRIIPWLAEHKRITIITTILTVAGLAGIYYYKKSLSGTSKKPQTKKYKQTKTFQNISTPIKTEIDFAALKEAAHLFWYTQGALDYVETNPKIIGTSRFLHFLNQMFGSYQIPEASSNYWTITIDNPRIDKNSSQYNHLSYQFNYKVDPHNEYKNTQIFTLHEIRLKKISTLITIGEKEYFLVVEPKFKKLLTDIKKALESIAEFRLYNPSNNKDIQISNKIGAGTNFIYPFSHETEYLNRFNEHFGPFIKPRNSMINSDSDGEEEEEEDDDEDEDEEID